MLKSGKSIKLYANIGSPADLAIALQNDAGGIGLFRSEFLFMGRGDLPSEDEQYEAYSRVARLFSDRTGPIVIRTLDVGADKALPALGSEAEDNPALGMRGIRLCLEKTAMLLEKWILMPNFEKCAVFSAHKKRKTTQKHIINHERNAS